MSHYIWTTVQVSVMDLKLVQRLRMHIVAWCLGSSSNWPLTRLLTLSRTADGLPVLVGNLLVCRNILLTLLEIHINFSENLLKFIYIYFRSTL
jgi:hypothetical protein